MSEFMIVNPRRKKRRAKKASRARKSRARSRSRSVMFHSNPVRRTKRRRRNPARAFSKPFAGIDLMQVGVGVIGATGASVLGGYARKLVPANFTGPVADIGVKVASYVGASMLASMLFGKQAGKTVLLAGGIIEGAKLVREKVLPGMGLSGIEDDFAASDLNLSGYVASSAVDAGISGMGAYESAYAPAY